jgi:hypothetical protein
MPILRGTLGAGFLGKAYGKRRCSLAIALTTGSTGFAGFEVASRARGGLSRFGALAAFFGLCLICQLCLQCRQLFEAHCYNYTFWYGLYGPANLAPTTVERLFRASVTVLADANVKQQLAIQGMGAAPFASVSEFKKLIATDGPRIARFASLKGSRE